jgi:hypothetical protein
MAFSHCVVYCVAWNLYVGFAQSADTRFIIQSPPYLSSSWILCNYWLLPYLVALQLRTLCRRLVVTRRIEKDIEGIAVCWKTIAVKTLCASVIRLWSRRVWILFLRLWCRVQLSCVATVSDEYVLPSSLEEGTFALKMSAAGSLVPVCRTARCQITI